MNGDIGPETPISSTETRPTSLHETVTSPTLEKGPVPEDTSPKKLERVRVTLRGGSQATPPPLIALSVIQKELYGKKYADIATSRYGKGLLVNHGEKAIKAFGNISKDAKILEVGCNTGPLMQQLTDAGFTSISGVDLNDAAILSAKEKGFQVSTGNAEHLEIPDNSLDGIVSLHTYEHVPNIQAALAEISRVLKPGGKAIIIEPPNLGGLETIKVAIEDLPPEKRGNGPLGFVKDYWEGWKYARSLHCSTLGWGIWGAKNHAQQILEKNNIDLKVSGGNRSDLMFASLLTFEKPLN